MKTFQVNEDVHSQIKDASQNTGLPINKLIALIIKVNEDWINDPVQVGEKMAMVTAGRIEEHLKTSGMKE